MQTLLDSLREKRAAKRAELDNIIPPPGDDGEQRSFTAEDDTRAGAVLAELAQLDERISELDELERREMAAAASRVATGDVTPERSAGGATVTREPLTYTQDAARRDGRSFLSDAYLAEFRNDYRARERIDRHQREMELEQRDLTTASMGGLIVPVYLTEQYADLAYAGRPVANAVNKMKLPATGMTLSIPKGVTGTAVAPQVAQNVPLVEQDLAINSINVPVVTIGGQQDVSRQALERGTGTDDVVFADLVANYAVSVDRNVLSGTGAAGEMLGITATAGINTVAYTTAAPKAGSLWVKAADAISRVQANRFLPPTVIFMHPRRWASLTSALGTDDRPLINAVNAQNALGTGDALAYGQVVGNIQGLPVVTDANFAVNLGAGTNEDAVIIARAPDLILWEESPLPRQLRFEATSPGSLTVKLVVYGYAAFTAARYPGSVSMITGTGLIPPTF